MTERSICLVQHKLYVAPLEISDDLREKARDLAVRVAADIEQRFLSTVFPAPPVKVGWPHGASERQESTLTLWKLRKAVRAAQPQYCPQCGIHAKWDTVHGRCLACNELYRQQL